LVNNELEKCGRKQSWCNLRHYHSICLEALRKTMTSGDEKEESDMISPLYVYIIYFVEMACNMC
jgi:hypothetical protein